MSVSWSDDDNATWTLKEVKEAKEGYKEYIPAEDLVELNNPCLIGLSPSSPSSYFPDFCNEIEVSTSTSTTSAQSSPPACLPDSDSNGDNDSSNDLALDLQSSSIQASLNSLCQNAESNRDPEVRMVALDIIWKTNSRDDRKETTMQVEGIEILNEDYDQVNAEINDAVTLLNHQIDRLNEKNGRKNDLGLTAEKVIEKEKFGKIVNEKTNLEESMLGKEALKLMHEKDTERKKKAAASSAKTRAKNTQALKVYRAEKVKLGQVLKELKKKKPKKGEDLHECCSLLQKIIRTRKIRETQSTPPAAEAKRLRTKLKMVDTEEKTKQKKTYDLVYSQVLRQNQKKEVQGYLEEDAKLHLILKLLEKHQNLYEKQHIVILKIVQDRISIMNQ